MKNYNLKTIVAPIVATGVLEYELFTHKNVPSTTVETVTTVAIGLVTFGISIWGYFKNHKKGA